MKICKNCGNENNHPEAKFCNHCGVYLKLAKKEIQYNLEKYKTMMSLKQTLIDGSKIINNDKSTTRNLFVYRDLIWSYLTEATNISDKIDDSMKKEFISSTLRLFNKLKKYSTNDILNEFLYEINMLYEEYEKESEKELKFIFYTNIRLWQSGEKAFNEMLPLFNLKVFNFNDFEFKKYEYLQNNFRSRYLILEYVARGKNYSAMKEDAKSKIKLFFGYLSFLHMYRKAPERGHVNELKLNHGISDLEISAILELHHDNSFKDFEESFDIVKTSKELEKSKIVTFRNNNLKYGFYKLLMESKNKRIVSKINQYLIDYYLASKETELDTSFIRFWSLSEKILKDIAGDMSYTKLVRYMEKILKYYHYPKYIQNRLIHIKHIRNNLVHQNIDNINQNDRNIIKTVADNLIWFIMEHDEVVNNITEYQIILDNFSQDTERTIKLLKLLNK